jgi:sulfur relay (sulfurtransferase) DsrC/TusE family protein
VFRTDEEGCLVDPHDWSEDVAEELARRRLCKIAGMRRPRAWRTG